MNTVNDHKLILITNDDGVSAQGIGVLTELMQQLGDVVVVAPDSARSGAACSISPMRPVQLKLVEAGEGKTVYTCSGTPVDCVKMASEHCVPRVPDLIVSGINHGDNASVSIHYSGTMGAVIEGCAKGIPSIGFSLRSFSHQCDFTPYHETIIRVARYVLENGLPEWVCLNVNFPVVDKLAGLRVCRMGRGQWEGEWMEAVNPYSQHLYWLTGKFINQEPKDADADYNMLDKGFATVTPIRLDMTDYDAMKALKEGLE